MIANSFPLLHTAERETLASDLCEEELCERDFFLGGRGLLGMLNPISNKPVTWKHFLYDSCFQVQ